MATEKTEKRHRSPNLARRVLDSKLRKQARAETREAQVQAAVYPSEVPLINAACARAGLSRSDFIREAVIAKAVSFLRSDLRPEAEG